MANQLVALDRELTATVDAALGRASRLSGKWLACRRGCTECCIGPFPVTALDAWRLRRGLESLATTDPGRAAAIRRRARAAAELMMPDFPGHLDTGLLSDDEAGEQAFAEKFHTVPCPALHPVLGTCELYQARPINCRTYGPAVCIDGDDLPPCHLCFVGARRRELEAARVRIRIAAKERAALEALGVPHATGGDTIVAFALARQE